MKMAKKHILKEEDFEGDLRIEKQIAGSFGGGENKELLVRVEFSFRGASSITTFIVKNKREVVEQTTIFSEAVKVYNSI